MRKGREALLVVVLEVAKIQARFTSAAGARRVSHRSSPYLPFACTMLQRIIVLQAEEEGRGRGRYGAGTESQSLAASSALECVAAAIVRQ